MKLKHTPGTVCLMEGDAKYTFLAAGDIYSFEHQSVLINGFIGNKKEGSANNIWLRIYGREGNITSYPLLGIQSGSRIRQSSNTLKADGTLGNISYEITFKAWRDGWFWDVQIRGEGETVDLVYGQDLGMAYKDAVLENELYAAQYLGHTVLQDADGYCICSRQNLPQNGTFPYICQGMLGLSCVSYTTDISQFFGLSYKREFVPSALNSDLPGCVRQGEGSYIGLQSEKVTVHGSCQAVIYGCFKQNHPQAVTEAEYKEEILHAYKNFFMEGEEKLLKPVIIREKYGTPYVSPMLTESEIQKEYPDKMMEERENQKEDEQLLSFFLPDGTHVALQDKELLVERSHGNIITTQADLHRMNNHLVTSTNYMCGFINGQITAGNTSKHKFLSVSRGSLDLLKNTGQRIWILLDGQYQMLTMPALFEVGLNYSAWLYVIKEDILKVTSYAVSDEMKIVTEVESRSGQTYDFLMTNQLVMGTHEFESDICVKQSEDVLCFTLEEGSQQVYPDLSYELAIPGIPYTWSDDRIFFKDNIPQNGTLLTIVVTGQSKFQIVIAGYLDRQDHNKTTCTRGDFDRERTAGQAYYRELLCGFHLEKEGIFHREIQKMNIIAKWYAHNAMVHFAVPHGLEQSGGAAWGTRDVCQGPMELFLALEKFDLARAVLLRIFENQCYSSGEWPQWFMFDHYSQKQEECHGDVVLWPLKCVGDYIVWTGDGTVLDELIPFADNKETHSLREHIRLAAESVKDRYLEGTHLISYAGGDWDDTLQPADESLKNCLVSAWTQALAAQVFTLLGKALASCGATATATAAATTTTTAGEAASSTNDLSAYSIQMGLKIEEDFHNYMIFDGVIAGFVCRTADGSFRPMLHPSDQTTGIGLRLLPLTRSIIAGIADQKLAALNMNIIDTFLNFPDGVRLMNRPAAYDGGVSKLFKRAEQAANVGREISLQYVHAHIRYIEALCRMGEGRKAWSAMLQINPIGIRDSVPHADYRQSNLYFSSSDGDFADRYEYSKHFEALYEGKIKVKGGWRIYSSGPGIYIHRLISDLLGIRFEKGDLVIDPVLPEELDGLKMELTIHKTAYIFCYHILTDEAAKLRIEQGGERIPAITIAEKYRTGGIKIKWKEMQDNIKEIHIFCPKR